MSSESGGAAKKSKQGQEAGETRRWTPGGSRVAAGNPAPDRIIHVPMPAGPSTFCDNTVYTTKYSKASFLPKFLAMQFSKAPNMFFLVIAVLQQIPGVSPTSRLSTILPLAFILAVSAVKELLEDSKRKKADDLANRRLTRIFRCGAEAITTDPFEKDSWSQVCVGHLVRVKRGEPFPADMVFLRSSDPTGLCFVETSNIDGETNLKIKEATQTDWRAAMSLTVEPPNEQIYFFNGSLLAGDQRKALKIANLLLRGSTLRNTDWIIGVVVYTGSETRIMRNSSTDEAAKQPRLDREVNYHMTLMLLVLLAMVVFSFAWWSGYLLLARGRYAPDSRWLFAGLFKLRALTVRFFTYVVLYHSIVPISLLVTLEVCRFHLARLVSSDLTFYPEDSQDQLSEESPGGVKVANSNVVDDLGQISYVLSDKTGTLTQNKMTLVKAADVNGTIFDCSTSAVLPAELAEAMGVCHTVMIEGRGGGSLSMESLQEATPKPEIQYQASSPDELAIVHGLALSTGLKFVERTSGQLILSQDDRRSVYQVLHLVEFSSERKRMSLVVQRPEKDDVLVLCKGADDAIIARLRQGQDATGVGRAVETFARSGLRTLCYGSRVMSKEEWASWHSSFVNKARPSSELEDELERGISLVGVTGVEDLLSEGVPESIALLQQASIKVWLLTGDRLETALNVAVACKLHTPEQQQLLIKSANDLETMLRGVTARPGISYALVIDGHAIDVLLEDAGHMDTFLQLATKCSSLLCCRTSPLQKAELTRHLQIFSKKLCLAIGDGANDVGMIRAAAVGIGIAGREGRQAARSADIAVPSFAALPRLLLVHGAWSYTRMAKTIVYCSYKNLLLVTCQFWFALVCTASGQTAFESWMLTLSNALFTSWVPIVIGVTDQHVPASWLLARPKLYARGQRNAALTPARFWWAALNAGLQSAGLLAIVGLAMGGDPVLASGRTGGMWLFSSTYYACALLTILLKAALLTASWNLYTFSILLFGILSWFAYLGLADLAAQSLHQTGMPLYALTRLLLGHPPFWFLLFLGPLAVLARDLAWKYYKRVYRPREYHIVQELDMLARRHRQLERPVSTAESSGSFSRLMGKQEELRNGFAFSQTAGQAALIS